MAAAGPCPRGTCAGASTSGCAAAAVRAETPALDRGMDGSCGALRQKVRHQALPYIGLQSRPCAMASRPSQDTWAETPELEWMATQPNSQIPPSAQAAAAAGARARPAPPSRKLLWKPPEQPALSGMGGGPRSQLLGYCAQATHPGLKVKTPVKTSSQGIHLGRQCCALTAI